MTSESQLFGVVIIAVLADRMLIARRPDAQSFPHGSTRLGRTIPAVLTAPALAMIAALLTGLIAGMVLTPLGALFLSALVFIAVMLAGALAGESLLGQGKRFSPLNRIFARATVVGSILGLAAIVLWPGQTDMEAASPGSFAAKAALYGVSYAVIRVIYDGILEKVSDDQPEKPVAPLAREMIMMSLLALVGIGILKIFH